jgi:4-amino-4-deoxy-L-arabinose transferase-like glycosyltransferase
MAAFLVPPLLVIYGAILYAYVIRIGITGEVPKNLVSPMVLAAGGLAALALLLFDPRPERGPADRALRWAPPLFLPLSVLGAAAILMRVDQYGWTEFRLLRLLLLLVMAGLAAAASLLLVRRRRFPLHVMLLVLAAALVLTASGPWGAVAVARRSQQARLDTALPDRGHRPGGHQRQRRRAARAGSGP